MALLVRTIRLRCKLCGQESSRAIPVESEDAPLRPGDLLCNSPLHHSGLVGAPRNTTEYMVSHGEDNTMKSWLSQYRLPEGTVVVQRPANWKEQEREQAEALRRGLPPPLTDEERARRDQVVGKYINSTYGHPHDCEHCREGRS